MATLREEAEFQRLALAMALTNVDAVVAWADRTIVALPEPPIQVIDVALAGSLPADQVVELLSAVPGGGDLTTVAHQVLRLFLQRFQTGDIALELAVEMLWAYHNWAHISEPERQEAANFDDALFLARQGHYGTLETVRQDILDFSRAHAAR
jgi:hypothetical protein